MKDEFIISKKEKSNNKVSDALFYCALISWFLAIWILPYRSQLVLTGIFCFVLCLLEVSSEKGKKKKDNNKKNE